MCKIWRRSQGTKVLTLKIFCSVHEHVCTQYMQHVEGIYAFVICIRMHVHVCMCVWACKCVCTLWSPQGWSAVGGVLGAAAASKLERRRPPEVCTAGTTAPQSCPRRGRWRRWWALWGGTGCDHDDRTECCLGLASHVFSVLYSLHPLSTIRTDRVKFDPGKVNTKPVLLFSR